MHPTLVLLDQWPNTRACPVSHDALNTHEFLKDVFLSDTEKVRSLRDMFSDGTLLAELRKTGVSIELFALNSVVNSIILGVRDICNRFEVCSNETDLFKALKTERCGEASLRIVVTGSSFQNVEKRQNSSEKAAAASSVIQSLAIRNILDLVVRIIEVSDASSCFFMSYASVMFSNGEWVRNATAGGLWPKQALMLAPTRNTSAPSLLTKLMKSTFPNIQDKELFSDTGIALTLDECDEGLSWTCLCRLIIDGTNFRVTRKLPPDGLVHLNKAFLAIENVEDWLVQDEGSDDNLVTNAEWMAGSNPAAILALCHPAVCELARFRTVVPIQKVPTTVPPLPDLQTDIPAPIELSTDLPKSAGAPADAPADVPAADAPADAPADAAPAAASADAPTSSAAPTDAPTSSAEANIRQAFLHKVMRTFDEGTCQEFGKKIDMIDVSLPYTLVHGKDKGLIVLQGTLTPDLLRHLAMLRSSVTLPDIEGVGVKLNGIMLGRSLRGVRIAGIKIDLEDYVQFSTLIGYRTRLNQPQDKLVQRSRQDLRDTESGRKGFAREMEKKRSLMMR